MYVYYMDPINLYVFIYLCVEYLNILNLYFLCMLLHR